MAKVVGLHVRGGVFHLRVMIPEDLRGSYQGRTKIIRSLGTAERAVAKILAHKLRADLLLGFEEMRRTLSPTPVQVVTPELAKLLADRVQARILKTDEGLRDNPAHLNALVAAIDAAVPSALLIGQAPALAAADDAPMDPLAGLTDDQAERLKRLNAGVDLKAAKDLARGNLAAVLPVLKDEAHSLGLAFDPAAPGAREALRAALAAVRVAALKLSMRDEGEVVETPDLSELGKPPAAPATTRTLREVYARWKASKDRSQDSHEACMRALVLFEGREPKASQDIATITRDMGDSFRSWLRQQGGSTKTARDRLTWMKSLLKYAFRDLEWISRHPWEGLDIDFKTENPRRPWTKEELEKLTTMGEGVMLNVYDDPAQGAGKNIGMGYNLEANKATVDADLKAAGVDPSLVQAVKEGRASLSHHARALVQRLGFRIVPHPVGPYDLFYLPNV